MVLELSDSYDGHIRDVKNSQTKPGDRKTSLVLCYAGMSVRVQTARQGGPGPWNRARRISKVLLQA